MLWENNYINMQSGEMKLDVYFGSFDLLKTFGKNMVFDKTWNFFCENISVSYLLKDVKMRDWRLQLLFQLQNHVRLNLVSTLIRESLKSLLLYSSLEKKQRTILFLADTEGQLTVANCTSMAVKDYSRHCSNLFDGSLSRVVKDGLCFVTKSSYKGWLELRLAKTSLVKKIVLLSKGNGTKLFPWFCLIF